MKRRQFITLLGGAGGGGAAGAWSDHVPALRASMVAAQKKR
jgi:hypothetical protein